MQLVALGDDNAYVAALVRSTAHVDLSAAVAHASKLPPLAAAGGLDLAELESGAGILQAQGMGRKKGSFLQEAAGGVTQM